MLTEKLRTMFPHADSDTPRRRFREYLFEAVFLIIFATMAALTHSSGTRWNAYYLPVLLLLFLVPSFLYQTYRSKRAFTLGYVFATQLFNCVLILFSFVVVELIVQQRPKGMDLCIALAVLFLVVSVEFFVMLVWLRTLASPKNHLQKSDPT